MTKSEVKKEFLVPSDLSRVQKTSAEVLFFLKPLALGDGALFDIRLCLEEALINAMKYGNGLDRDLKVRMTAAYREDRVQITVEDEGPGFNPQRLKDCTREGNLLQNHGRGVYLMHRLMDRVKYNSKGNSVEMIKFFKKNAKEA